MQLILFLLFSAALTIYKLASVPDQLCTVPEQITKATGLKNPAKLNDLLWHSTPLGNGWYTIHGTQISFNVDELCKNQNDGPYNEVGSELNGTARNETIIEKFLKFKRNALRAANIDAYVIITFACMLLTCYWESFEIITILWRARYD